MKTTLQAKNQAQKLLSYNMKMSSNFRLLAEKMYNKKQSNNTALRVKNINEVYRLNKLADMYQQRGQKAWGLFLNNPNYYGWMNQI